MTGRASLPSPTTACLAISPRCSSSRPTRKRCSSTWTPRAAWTRSQRRTCTRCRLPSTTPTRSPRTGDSSKTANPRKATRSRSSARSRKVVLRGESGQPFPRPSPLGREREKKDVAGPRRIGRESAGYDNLGKAADCSRLVACHHCCRANVARQIDPITVERFPGPAVDGHGGQWVFVGCTEAQANLFWWIATRALDFGGDLILCCGVNYARWPEVSRSAFETAFPARIEPRARDGLTEQ